MVQTTIPYPLIWEEGNFSIRVGVDVFDVHFKRQSRQSEDHTREYSVAKANRVEIRYDRLGRVAFTSVDILFPRLVANQDEHELRRMVLAVLNRLIEVYRFTTGEYYLESIPMHELREYDTSIIKEDGSKAPEMAHSGTFGYGLTLARYAPIPDMSRQLLLTGAEVPVPDLLLLNARREYLLEDYRIAVVQAETAFEALVDEVVSHYYRATGRSDAEVDVILNNTGLKNLLKDHIPKCCTNAFVGTQEYTTWESDLYSLRNAVVHRGASVDAAVVNKAIDAGEKAMKWIASGFLGNQLNLEYRA